MPSEILKVYALCFAFLLFLQGAVESRPSTTDPLKEPVQLDYVEAQALSSDCVGGLYGEA